MTILRSREIIPKFPQQTLKPRKLEPSTPKKLNEPSMSSTTPSPPPPASKGDHLVLGFDSESVSTTPVSSSSSSSSSSSRIGPRRSLRIASKSKMSTENDIKNPITGKDVMNLNVDKEKESSSGSDTGNRKSGSKRKKSRVLCSGRKKSRVYESVNEGGCVSKDLMDLNELGEDGEKGEIEEKDAMDLGKLSSSSDSGSLRRSERLVNASHGKEKRDLGIDLNSMPLDAVVEGNDNGFSSFRSGTRVTKRKIEVIDLDSDSSQPIEGNREDKEREPKLVDESGKVFDLESLQLGLNSTFDCRGKSVDVEILETDPNTTNADDENTSVHGKRKYSLQEKGKGRLMENNWLSIGHTPMVEWNLCSEEEFLLKKKILYEEELEKSKLRMAQLEEEVRHAAKEEARMKKSRRRGDRNRFHDIAKENAARFARFQREEEEDNRLPPVFDNDVPAPEFEREIEDWPGPFSTAMKIINDRNRATKVNAARINSTSGVSIPATVIEWTPSEVQGKSCTRSGVPLLQDLCLQILAKNAEAIVSLKAIPDAMRHKLSHLLCDSRRMDCHFMELLASGSPTEIRVKDCSWITEDQITKILDGCDTNNLTVLQLDLCGRCMPDYILSATLARSPNSLPALASISLKGACRLTDIGLKALVTSAPALSSINLSQCSLLSSSGINTLADSLGSALRELYLDDCQNIDIALILPALKKLEHLEVLSVAGIETVCDDLVREVVTECGQNMKELIFADCWKLTDISLKAVAENCSGLCALDLSNVRKLTDSALVYLANGCRSIQTLKLCRNAFSDEAVAAFLEASGDPLTELSLNNVKKVGHNTALSLARRCSRNLLSLDLSWCRNLADAAVGLIVDNCSSLRVLKLFGCTQITKVFVNGHSNPLVRIVGLKMTPILEHIDVLGLQEAPLRYSPVPLCS